ncbi:MAG: redoxin family protein [Planctomycetia bacterium]|nr:redoxin family protein [Planctomycetia bacterium]
MAIELSRSRVIASLAASLVWSGGAFGAERPNPEKVLKALQPVQKDVQIDRPSGSELAKCTIELADNDTTWVIRDAGGQILRRFMDTNRDKKVDQWCYYKDGVEVYRDIDTNFNEAADQYRWFNTAGTRWGEDPNEDKQIDSWKSISAEEVSAEVVAAIRDRDRARFERLLLTPKELKTLGIGKAKSEQLLKKITAAAGGFNALAAQQKQFTPETKWVSFGGNLPGLVPAGTEESTADLVVYENVAAMVETAGKPLPITLGTLVRVKDAWRLIDVPVIADENTADNENKSFFFAVQRTDRPEQQAGRPSDRAQELMKQLQKLDASGAATPQQHEERAELLEKLAKEADSRELRIQWYRQLADTVSAAVQSGAYPGGVEKLKTLQENLKTDPQDDELACYVQFRRMFAEHGQALSVPTADFQKIQTQWVEDLENFVKATNKYPDSAEAMLELAISQEFAGEDEQALKWYGAIEKGFPNSPTYRKAVGAKLRLQSVGRSIPLSGKTVDGKSFNLAAVRNKVVLIQYWATWCEPCTSDMPLLEKLRSKYGKSGFEVVGVCLDTNKADMLKFLRENDPGWPQLFEEGGLENRFAVEMGIMNLPTMILVDKQGKVVNRNIRANELDGELKTLLK